MALKKIGNRAFDDCKKLESITIPNSVKSIGTRAFGYRYNNTTHTNEKVPNFKIYCTKGSAGERYAKGYELDYELIEAPEHTHTFGEWKVTQEPTCTEKGIKERVCSECGEKETEEIPATGHTFGEWKVTKEPTTTETGLKERVCSVCGEKETEVIPKLEDTKPTEPTNPTNPTTTTINAPKMVNTTSTNNSVKVRWNSAKDVDGYIITTYCDDKKVKSADVGKNTVTTIGGLKISKNYLFGVKSYKMVNGKKVYGKEVGLKASTLPSAPKLTVKAGKKSAKLSWKKVPNATKYEVYMKVGKSYKKVAAVKGTSFTKKGLKSGGKYSFKIKTIKVANFKADAKYGMNKRTKIYTSKPSAIKTVKVK